jgi:alpha,alpha-trehalase
MAVRHSLAALSLPGILDYIKSTWAVLTRTHRSLALAAVDPKFPVANGLPPVYVSQNEDLPRVEAVLRAEMPPSDFEKIQLLALPSDSASIREHGLLYLPRPWVVPGGRFNEMYGWDSYFIQMGLLRDAEFALAHDLADNFIYQIHYYGKILNANRTYYLTRSQPPFLTPMLLAVYRHTQDRNWLRDSLPAIEKYYQYWTSEPHLTPETGLSRYHDSGEGPAPEVVSSELDSQGRTDYDLIRAFFRTHHLSGFDAGRFYDTVADQLTPLFYQNDRAMRESGFDPSSRFGPFGAGIVNCNPVCLNSLLCLMESQMAEIFDILGQPGDAAEWRRRAADRASRINRLMWDAARGLWFDYDFVERRTRPYPFLTTFYPLWAGVADAGQASAVVGNLHLFERPGGLLTSTFRSGAQWDAPYGWAPLQWIAVQALRRFGYHTEADRVSMRFLSLIELLYQRHGVIVEKYDVTHRSDTARGLLFGYHSNEVGFGWTNAVFTSLYDGLSPARRRDVLKPV